MGGSVINKIYNGEIEMFKTLGLLALLEILLFKVHKGL